MKSSVRSPRIRPKTRRQLRKWLTSDEDLWYIAEALDDSPHFQILNKSAIANLRRADPVEVKAGKIVRWVKK